MRSSQRVVKKRLADGTVKTYTYARKAQQSRFADDTLGALILEYKRSPEWAGLADATHRTYNVYLKVLEADPHTRASAVTRRDILALRDAVATTRGNGAATGFIRAASALFSWAVDREWIDNTPVTRIKSLPGGSLPPWSASHAAHALARLSEPLRRAVVLALRTGPRRGDLVAMRWRGAAIPAAKDGRGNGDPGWPRAALRVGRLAPDALHPDHPRQWRRCAMGCATPDRATRPRVGQDRHGRAGNSWRAETDGREPRRSRGEHA